MISTIKTNSFLLKTTLSFFVFFLVAVAQNPSLESAVKVTFNAVQDRYYPQEKIRFRVTLYNAMPYESFRFYIYQNSFEQIYLNLKNQRGELLFPTPSFNKFLNRKKKSTFNNLNLDSSVKLSPRRLIEILPGESFSFIISLDDFYQIDTPEYYYGEGYFYPLGINIASKTNTPTSLDNDESYHLPIVPFSFALEPYLNEPYLNKLAEANATHQDEKTVDSLTPFLKHPTDVVTKHLNSIQMKKWKDYLETLNFEKFLMSTYPSTDYYERYQNAYPQEKNIIIKEFKNFLIDVIDYDLEKYRLIKTVITESKAEVEVAAQTIEPFQNLILARDPESGLIKERWISEKQKNLKRKFLITFKLEKEIELVDQPLILDNGDNFSERFLEGQISPTRFVWKIVGQDIKIVDNFDFTQKTPAEPRKEEIIKESPDFFKEIILFSLNNYEINPKYFSFLNQLAQFLKLNPLLTIDIEGHTDDLGNEQYNIDLSLARALSVENYLVEQGVDRNRLSLIPKGEASPVTDNESEYNRHLNRRVKIIVKEKL